MKKKNLIAAIIASASLLAAVGAVTFGNAETVKADPCDHVGNHYTELAPGLVTIGTSEYWVCCKCKEHYLTEPSTGTWTDAGQADTVASYDDRYLPMTGLLFEGGYATGDLIQLSTGQLANTPYKFTKDFTVDDSTVVSSWNAYGTAAVGWVEHYDANPNIICLHFNSPAEGQYLVIEAGTEFICSGYTCTLKNTIMLIRNATTWTARNVDYDEITFKMIAWPQSNAVMMLTNSYTAIKGDDTSGGGNGYISLVHPNDTVLWGYYGAGLHDGYNYLAYMNFVFNTDVEAGKVMVIGKGTTLVLSDDSVVEFKVTYKLTKTETSWALTVEA